MTPDPIRVIVLGPYSGDILAVAGNIRRGMELAAQAALAGFAVFPCWWDWQLATLVDLPMEWFKTSTIAWMRVADAILLAPNWEQSEGVRAELAIAHELGIPVFTSLESLICWRNSLNDPDDERTGDCVEYLSGFPVITGDLKRLDLVPLTDNDKQTVLDLFDNEGTDQIIHQFVNDPTPEIIDRVLNQIDSKRKEG